MANYRRGRINEELTRELAGILREIKDPRIQRNLVTVTACDVTADLKYAKVFFSVVGKDADPKEVKKGLESAKGFMRREIAHRLNLRITPDLTFHHDQSAENGAHIMSLLRSVDLPDYDEEDND